MPLSRARAAKSALCVGALCMFGAAAAGAHTSELPPEPLAAPAQFFSNAKAETRVPGPAAAAQPAERLDALFAQLAASSSPQKAEPLARAIEKLWGEAGGSTAGLLSERAMHFMAKGRFDEAAVLMDQAVLLQPRFADGWQRRARLHLHKSRPRQAMLDIRTALRFEPRHYVAWAELGRILDESGDEFRALAAYRRALAVHPHLAGVKERVDRLSVTVRGSWL